MSTSIKFNHSKSKKLEFDHSGMGLTNLLVLGALEFTAEESCEKNGFKKIYGTDEEGMKKTSDQAQQLLLQLNVSIEAVSNLAANSSLEDVPESVNNVFYLIHGLTQLANNVTAIKSDIDFALDQQA